MKAKIVQRPGTIAHKEYDAIEIETESGLKFVLQTSEHQYSPEQYQEIVNLINEVKCNCPQHWDQGGNCAP